MQLHGLLSVHELEVFLMNQAEAEDPVDEESDENDPEPWAKYEKTGYKSKAPPRPKTKTTQGVKNQPAPTIKERENDTKRTETRTDYRLATGDRVTEVIWTLVDKSKVIERSGVEAMPKSKKNGSLWGRTGEEGGEEGC
jgi:hypothetical protein